MKKYFLYLFLLAIAISSCTQHTPSRHIVVIGDSNAARKLNWVIKLDSLLPDDSIVNCAISGNTIGFDNNGRKDLNELRNIDEHLKTAENKLNNIDIVIVGLGTNDCKTCFDSLKNVVPGNFEKLISKIKGYNYKSGKAPEIVVLCPPQVGPDSMLLAKYQGISGRLDTLIPRIKEIALKNNCKYVNIRDITTPDFAKITFDGIHYKEEGYNRISKKIYEAIALKK